MKILLLPSRTLLVPLALALAAALHAQSNATPPALGLLRLKSTAKPNEAAPLAAAKFAVDDLSTSGAAGATKGKKNNVDYLALNAGKEWSRPIRGSAKDVTFVSFQLLASQTTVVDIAGARLGVTAANVSGDLQLMFDDSSSGTLQWKSLNYHVSTAKYDGKNLVDLPTLTVRLDSAAGTWDLFSGGRLLADDLPLITAKKNDRKFVLTAGTEGVWLVGLVLSDENPIYEDANGNGIDDAFEQQSRGTLMSAKASAVERKVVAQQWKDAQRAKPPQAFYARRPMPDNMVRQP